MNMHVCEKRSTYSVVKDAWFLVLTPVFGSVLFVRWKCWR